jgi:hypothetical protein
MKILMSLAALVAIAVVGVALAQEGDAPKKCTKCPSSSAAVATCSKCPISAAIASLPKMTYTIGEETTCCKKSAASMAKKASAPIHYVVAAKTYEDETEAYTALVESTEAYVNDYISPSKCEKSGKTTVAGKACGCHIEAGKRAKLVTTAVQKVKMTYKVGDEEVCCSKMAAGLAEKSGEPTHYLVGGEELSCDLTARLKLATAKYKAAVQAITAADQSAAKTPATKGAGT